jgi:spore coat protein U-like protein
MNRLCRVLSAVALLAAGTPLSALAQVNVNVQVQVQGNCNVSAPIDADFGLQGPLVSTNLPATGQVTLTCNRGAAPLVAVSNGNNFSGTRRMANGANFVPYAVKQPTITGTNYTVCPAFGGGSAFGTGVDELDASAAFTASGGPRTVTLCFETTVDQNTVIATYTDTVVVSVSF